VINSHRLVAVTSLADVFQRRTENAFFNTFLHFCISIASIP